ncbi:Response regulator rcp1 [Arenibacter antarcticus]|uniref:Response regulator n=1 Tax=Arenibacter antarcticus TaxID=2040469 RepID=A0ABW5VEZ9_9FLAO|nr:response regulator [Arenibacter sp. H213]MCM4168081.1 response regulator [Arenibacter sp. H213]
MKTISHILLADDDPDDCMFFREALEALSFSTQLTFVKNGEELIELLSKKTAKLPDILFMDLNMPRKSGIQCLSEIKNNQRLQNIPVVIISTSYDCTIADGLYHSGASYYIQKPIGFSQLQNLISLAVELVTKENILRPERINFLLEQNI